MRLSKTLLALAAIVHAFARPPKYNRGVDSLLGDIAYAATRWSAGFTFWIQLLEEPVSSQFVKLFEGKHPSTWTILMPNSTALDVWITAQGGNTTEIDSFSSKQWKQTFTELYPYFFFSSILNTTAVAIGDTVVLDSWKKSPVGDWPLSVAYRREATYEISPEEIEIGNGTIFPYNGTFYASPFSAANVTIPDYSAHEGSVANIIDLVLVEPQNLSVTIAELGIVGWSNVVERVPIAAALETSHNFTLLLPPTSAFTTALAGSDADLMTFVETHLVSERFVLSASTNTTFTTLAGSTGNASPSEITVGGVTASVVQRDVLTNGIFLQVIDRALTTSSNTTAPTSSAHSEL